MTFLRLLVVAASLAAAAPAAAQLSNRSIAVESGLSAGLGAREGLRGAVALTATAWLDGDLEAIARVSFSSGPETPGRPAAAAAYCGTAGLRLSLLPGPLRPQASLEVGWARGEGPTGPVDRLALGAGVGLEWFAARDLSIAARGTLRGFGGAPSFELVLGAAAYF